MQNDKSSPLSSNNLHVVTPSLQQQLLAQSDDFSDADWGGLPPNGDFVDTHPLQRLLRVLNNPEIMGNLETLLSESYKFLRMADDLHSLTSYMNDMRLCFIAITISVYIAMLVYGIAWCFARNRTTDKNAQRQRNRRQQEMEMGGAMEQWPPAPNAPNMTSLDTSQYGNSVAQPTPAILQVDKPARGESNRDTKEKANDVGYRYTSSSTRPASFQRHNYHKTRLTEDNETATIKKTFMNTESRPESPPPSSFTDLEREPILPQAGPTRSELRTTSHMPRQITIMREVQLTSDSLNAPHEAV